MFTPLEIKNIFVTSKNQKRKKKDDMITNSCSVQSWITREELDGALLLSTILAGFLVFGAGLLLLAGTEAGAGAGWSAGCSDLWSFSSFWVINYFLGFVFIIKFSKELLIKMMDCSKCLSTRILSKVKIQPIF